MSNINSNKNNSSKNNSNKNSSKVKRPANPKYIPKSKYFKVSTRDSNRIKNIKEGMNHLFDVRNREIEEAFLQEAAQYTERVLGETRRIHLSEEEDHEAMDVIFNNTMEEVTGAGLDVEEIIDGAEEPEEESETLDSEEVLALQERIQQEDQEEYDRIRAELDEEEANNDN